MVSTLQVRYRVATSGCQVRGRRRRMERMENESTIPYRRIKGKNAKWQEPQAYQYAWEVLSLHRSGCRRPSWDEAGAVGCMRLDVGCWMLLVGCHWSSRHFAHFSSRHSQPLEIRVLTTDGQGTSRRKRYYPSSTTPNELGLAAHRRRHYHHYHHNMDQPEPCTLKKIRHY